MPQGLILCGGLVLQMLGFFNPTFPPAQFAFALGTALVIAYSLMREDA